MMASPCFCHALNVSKPSLSQASYASPMHFSEQGSSEFSVSAPLETSLNSTELQHTPTGEITYPPRTMCMP